MSMEKHIEVQSSVQEADAAIISDTPITVIANDHLGHTKGGKPIPLLQHYERFNALLDEARQHFERTASESMTSSIAGEWLLDNYYIVQAAMQELREDMPPAYYKN